ncbi:hypothetical protein [Devosia sp. DBB001]|nr:hypothetical protein [Devosia sp. DBB001]
MNIDRPTILQAQTRLGKEVGPKSSCPVPSVDESSKLRVIVEGMRQHLGDLWKVVS